MIIDLGQHPFFLATIGFGDDIMTAFSSEAMIMSRRLAPPWVRAGVESTGAWHNSS